nr:MULTISPECIES: histidine kinase [Microbacterium]
MADVLIAFVCLVFSLVPATTIGTDAGGADPVARAWASAVITATVVAACVLLVWRRRWPTAVFVASLVAATAYLLSPVAVGGPLLLVTSYTLAVYRSTRACVVGLIIGLTTLTTVAIGLSATGTISVAVAANAVVGEAILALIGALIGVNVGNRKRYLEAIIARSRQLLVERDQQAQLAAVAERARIAREMHDVVSHSLTVIVALADGATATEDRDRARAASGQAAATARAALHEMRAMLGVLRDETAAPDAPLTPVDDDTVPDAVAAARRAGFPVSLHIRGDASAAPRPVRLAVARIVQEGLTNAMRHSPYASTIDVTITATPAQITVDVVNDGALAAAEPDAAIAGYGLRGLRERIDHVGGVLQAGPEGDGRWRVHATLPMTDAREDS